MGDYNDPFNNNQQSDNTDQSQNQQPDNQQPDNQQPQYGQSQYNQPQNGQPQYSQPQYQQPQYGGQSQYQPQNQQNQQNQQYQQYQQPSYSQYQPQPRKFSPLALASLLCGSISFLLSCCLWFIIWISSIAGIILGILCLSNNRKNNIDNGTDKIMSIIGIVLCGVSLLIVVLILVYWVIVGNSLVDLSNYSSDIY